MCIRVIIFLFFLFGLRASAALAQAQPPDSVIYALNSKPAVAYFIKTAGSGIEVNNGRAYDLYPPANKGTFYFDDKNYCVPAIIRYNGVWYKDIPVLYDAHNDLMISTQNNSLFVLSTAATSEVYLLDHHFVYASSSADLPSGYYDELYKGKVQVLAKRIKVIDEHIVPPQKTETFYIDKTVVYVKNGNKYYQVDSKGTITDAFKDKKKQVSQYVNDNKFDLRKDTERAVVKVAAYYDQLSN